MADKPMPAQEPHTPELLEVGRIVGAQGLQGELRVNPLSDFPERFTRPGRRWLRDRQGTVQETRLLAGRQLPGKQLFVIRLEGVADRTAAEALVGRHLLVPAQERPRLAPGEFHLLDLLGLEVRLLEAPGQGGSPADAGSPARGVGRVRDLLHAGNDLLEVELSEGERRGRTLLIPFVQAIVPRVEVAEGWIGITPPPGLLELAEGGQDAADAPDRPSDEPAGERSEPPG